ncbi:hypothetical protein Bhyg_07866 [Pseudolycoriella hygida]|uniref:Uncharacterized protein n=1 Tax=Pseudolycoriella hygida TaxID=35572 RepID=A0A9Q0S489_9DIPT|nr:hypothetical protein Bhyg_07866 [Pseudolycoriella hygida]
MANALRLLAMKYKTTITQKFLEVGHTHMECDSTHACIERKSKGMTFDLPSDFVSAIVTARDKPFPFFVEHLTHSFFRNYDDQEFLTLKSIRPGKKKGEPKVAQIRCIQYMPDGKILYKLRFDDEFGLLPQPIKGVTISEPKILQDKRIPVSNSKWKHLQELKAVLPSECYSFYDNIPHLGKTEKIVSEDEKLKNLTAKVKLFKATSRANNQKK